MFTHAEFRHWNEMRSPRLSIRSVTTKDRSERCTVPCVPRFKKGQKDRGTHSPRRHWIDVRRSTAKHKRSGQTAPVSALKRYEVARRSDNRVIDHVANFQDQAVCNLHCRGMHFLKAYIAFRSSQSERVVRCYKHT